MILPVDPARPARDVVARAAEALRNGGLVILPTDTVYGLAADPRAPGAVDRLFQAKGRDAGKPVPFLIDNVRQIRRLGGELSHTAGRLARRFWPGPLTLVLPAGARFEGFRLPDHAVTRAVIRACGTALRVTSANRSGEQEAHTAAAAAARLANAAALALDAGPSPLGRPSTVVRVQGDTFEVIREGAIPIRDVREACAEKILVFVCSGNVCRSPMAEYLMRHMLGANSEWTVRSAGTSAFDGMPASPEAVHVLDERHIDIRAHRSRRLTREWVDAASAIVVMTASHRATVLDRFPDAAGKVHVLKSFGPGASFEDVMDPIGCSVQTYRRIRDEIDAVLPDLALFLHEQPARKAGAEKRKSAP